MRPAAISRRAVLGLVVVGSLTGCGVRWVDSPETTPTAQRGPDDDARDAAVTDARAVAALAATTSDAPPQVQAAVTAVAAATAAHRRALGDDPVATAEANTSAGTTSGTTAPPGIEVTDLLTLLARTAGDALGAVAPLGAGTARLLVSVAASRAVLLTDLATAAGLIAPTVATPSTATLSTATPSTATPSTATLSVPAPTGTAGTGQLAALQRALAGEHEAVYAYGLVAARAAAPRRAEALADLDTHRVSRDHLDAAVRARGGDPVAAAAGYEVAAATPEAAALLAAAVEERLAAVYEDVVGADLAWRGPAAGAVLRAARAAARWGSPVRSFPGLPALSEDGGPAVRSPSGTSPDAPASSDAPAAPGAPASPDAPT